MALLKCPECGHDVSSEAEACPHCGYPIKKKIKTKESYSSKKITTNNRKRDNIEESCIFSRYSDDELYDESDGSYVAGLILGLLLGAIGALIAMAIDKEDTRRGAVHGCLISLALILIWVVVTLIVTFSQMN